MAEDIKLTWEWPLDREPQTKLIVAIDTIKEDTGFFGLKKSPSVDGYLPDPITLTGKVVSENSDLTGKSIRIKLPKAETGGTNSGKLVAIGIHSSNLCICLKPVKSIDEDLSAWRCASHQPDDITPQ